jgi:DNA polymerase-3 subunit delta'
MSARRVEAEISAPHPRETFELFGHREAETALRKGSARQRSPIAWRASC